MVSSQDWVQSCTAISTTESSIILEDTVGKHKWSQTENTQTNQKQADCELHTLWLTVLYLHGCFSTASRTFSITSSSSEGLTDSSTSTRYLLASLEHKTKINHENPHKTHCFFQCHRWYKTRKGYIYWFSNCSKTAVM